MATGLLTAGGGHAWETDVVAALDQPGALLSVVRRCADIADVLATAATGQAAVCLLAADLRRLDSEAVQRLAGFGVAVVVVHAAADARAPARLERIGVVAAVGDDAGAAAIIISAQQAMSAGPASAVGRGAPRSTADPRWALDRPPDVETAEDPGGPADGRPGGPADGKPARPRGIAWPAAAAPSGRAAAGSLDPGAAGTAEPATAGTVVAVWGPGGAPGRSTVAAGLSDHAAATGRSVLLVDADVYGGILASAFGLLDESSGLAGACRMAANGRLDTAELAGLCWAIGERLALLTGIARPDRWPEVRPSAIPAVLRIARQLADLVVVDCAAVLEADEELSFDTMAPRRNGATLAVLDEADVVLAVGSADPPGMERLVRGLAELTTAVDGAEPQVVLNRVRRTAASAAELLGAVRRFSDIEPLALLPEDRTACDRAWQLGVALSEAAPRSALTTGLGALTRTLLRAVAPVRVEV